MSEKLEKKTRTVVDALLKYRARLVDEMNKVDEQLKTGERLCVKHKRKVALTMFYAIPASKDGLSKDCSKCRSSLASKNYKKRNVNTKKTKR